MRNRTVTAARALVTLGYLAEVAVLCCGVLALGAQAVVAEGLLKKLSEGAEKAGQAIGNSLETVDKTIESTVDLATNDESPEELRRELDTFADDTLSELTSENPEAEALFQQSYGYAVFDARKATLMGVSAGFGRGVAVAPGTGSRTYLRLGSGGVGISFGIGGFVSKVVVLFEDEAAFQRLLTEGAEATASAGAMVGDETASESVPRPRPRAGGTPRRRRFPPSWTG